MRLAWTLVHMLEQCSRCCIRVALVESVMLLVQRMESRRCDNGYGSRMQSIGRTCSILILQAVGMHRALSSYQPNWAGAEPEEG